MNPYDEVCIDPIFDLSFEAQESIARYNERHGLPAYDPFALFDDDDEEVPYGDP